MAYSVKIQLKESEKESGFITIPVKTRGQAKAVDNGMKETHTVETTVNKVVDFTPKPKPAAKPKK